MTRSRVGSSIAIPLVKPFLPDLEEISGMVEAMLRSGRVSNFGSFVQELEERVKLFLGVKHAVTVGSGTTGLLLLLSTLSPGSEVIVPSFTFPATVQALLWNGLIPVFADVNPETMVMGQAEIEPKLSPRTSAILAVHSFGNPCDTMALTEVTRRAGVRLFFDSAHAFGAKAQGDLVGGAGDAEVFSFSATKLLCCGEGGMIVTNREEIYQNILEGRNYGFGLDMEGEQRTARRLGLNGKMTEFAAILGLWGLKSVPDRVIQRNSLASRYRQELEQVDGISFQLVREGDLSSFKDFVILVDPTVFGRDRDQLREALQAHGVETRAYFSPPIHGMPFVKARRIQDSDLQSTEDLASRIISLPIYSHLTERELLYITKCIREARG